MISLPDITLAVVGADYPNKRGPTRRFEIAICKAGENVVLRPEPKNPADPNAIAVFSCRSIQIGYLTAERAARIGQLMRECEPVAVFDRASPFGAWIRVAFDGSTLDVPDTRAPKESQPDWWPDEEWPD